MFLGVAVEELAVRLCDADDLNIGPLQIVVEEAGDVTMRETDDADTEGTGRLRANVKNSKKQGEP